MQHTVNAIRRLSHFMHTIASKADGGQAFSAILCREFDIQADDVVSLHRSYTSILELFEEVIAEGENIENPTQKNLFLAPVLELQNNFKRETIRSAGSSFHIVEPTLSKLKYAAEFINTSTEQPVEAEVLKDLMKDTEAMIAQIVESDLPKYLKGRLIEILENFRFAITTYNLRGISGLRKVTEEMMGTLGYNKNEITQNVNNSKTTKKTIFDLADFISKASSVVEFATKMKELAAPVISWLLPKAGG